VTKKELRELEANTAQILWETELLKIQQRLDKIFPTKELIEFLFKKEDKNELRIR